MLLIIKSSTKQEDLTMSEDEIMAIENLTFSTLNHDNCESHGLLFSDMKKGNRAFHEFLHRETGGLWRDKGNGEGWLEARGESN
ncbi:hypothetical protein D3C72_929720 [compost metagenome]